MTTSFMVERTDQVMEVIDLTMVSGCDNEAQTTVGKWIEKTLGDGGRTHEDSDYVDEAIKVVGAMIAGQGCSNVHQPPGSENPASGVWYCFRDSDQNAPSSAGLFVTASKSPIRCFLSKRLVF